MYNVLFFIRSGDPRDLHGLTHSFPTRRSSDLVSTRGRKVSVRFPRLVAERALPPAATRFAVGAYAFAILVTIGGDRFGLARRGSFGRSEEHTSELQSLMRISYAVFCSKKKNILTYKMTTRIVTIHQTHS